jgi:TRAP-type mannitol/chloroaromatic compound transport system substrate-binding protein
MPRIVISYRRSDSAAMAGRIFDRLHAHYGDQSMFMDIDNIPFGTDFRRFIKDTIGQSDVLVAVVGPRWLGPRDAGGPRIHDATDPVRLEIEGALQGGLPIIPVLVDGAQMPGDEELPDNLKDFAFINAAPVDIGRDFRAHVDRLIRGIDDILAKAAAPATEPSAPSPALEPMSRPEAQPATIAQGEAPRSTDAPVSVPSPRTHPPPVSPDVSDSTSPAPPASRPYRYAAVAGIVLVAIGLVALISRNWSSDPQPTTTSTARIDPTPAPARESANVATPQANAPMSAPASIGNRPPANAAAPSATLPPSIRWRLQHTLASRMPAALPFFARRVAELSHGRMEIEVLSSIQPSSRLLNSVQGGEIDLGFGLGSFLYGTDRTFALMKAVPFGFSPRDHLAFRRRPDVAGIFGRLLAQQNAVALPCGSFGRNGEVWLNKPLMKTADLVGAKLRFVGLAADVYRELGTTVMVVSQGEIFTAFQGGVIVGTEAGSPSDDDDFGLPDLAKHFYYPGVVTPATIFDLYVGKRKWDALGPAGRQIIEQACGDAAEAMLNEHERRDTLALDQFARKKVTVSPLPGAVQRDLYAATRRVLARFSAENPSFREAMAIVDEMRSSTLAADLR